MAGRKVYCVGNGVVARVFADSARKVLPIHTLLLYNGK